MAEGGYGEDLSQSTLVGMGSEDWYEFFCQPCDVDGDHIEASSFCQQCEEYLCTNCASYHRKQKQMRYHALQDLQQMTNKRPVLQQMANKPPVSMNSSTEKCQYHAGKLIEYVCKEHRALGCQACMTIYHAACTKLYIPKISKGYTNSHYYKQFRVKLNDADKKPAKLISVVDKQKNMSDTEHSKVKSVVKKERADMDRRLDKWEKDMYVALDNSGKTTEASLSAAADAFKQVQQEVTTMTSQIDLLQQSQQDSNLYIAVMRSQSKVTALDHKLTTAGANIRVSRPVFRPNRSLQDKLDQPDALGQLLIQDGVVTAQARAATGSNPDTRIKVPTDRTRPQAPTKAVTMATHVRNIKVGNDINSSALMSTNQLLVADCGRLVRLVDTGSGRLVSELKLSGVPWQVTRISDTEAAVTIPDEKKIVLLRTQPKLSVVRKIRVQGECYGIALMDNTLVVTFGEDNVGILDMSGKCIRTISTDQTSSKIFSAPRRITVDPDTGSMFVSDCGEILGRGRKVVKLSKEGSVLATYSGDGRSWLRQVALDTQGMIYVALQDPVLGESGSVEQLSANCDWVRTIIPDLKPAPWALSYDKATQQLYVGQWNGVVKVYRLS